MNTWTVQFVASPPFERPNQVGVAVWVEIDEIAPGTCITRCWKTEFVGMDWMQDLPIQESRQGLPFQLQQGLAADLLSSIRTARVGVAALGDLAYIHPTTYRLIIRSGFNGCSLEWVHELPLEWTELRKAVEVLESIGRSREK